jgi:RNA-binding protein YlmH
LQWIAGLASNKKKFYIYQMTPNTENLTENEIDIFEDEINDIVKVESLNIIVDKGQELLRIDKFVQARVMGSTRSKVQKGIDDELVLVNGKPIKSNYKVRPLDHNTKQKAANKFCPKKWIWKLCMKMMS